MGFSCFLWSTPDALFLLIAVTVVTGDELEPPQMPGLIAADGATIVSVNPVCHTNSGTSD